MSLQNGIYYQNTLFKEAERLLKEGLNITPTIGKKSVSKNTGVSLQDFKKLTIERGCNGLGIVSTANDLLVCFDCDTKDATKPKHFSDRLIFELKMCSFLDKIKLSRSPSGGYHLYIKVPNLQQKKNFANGQAWSSFVEGEKQKNIITGRVNNAYCCEYPTANYNWIFDNVLEALSESEQTELKGIFSNLNEDKERVLRLEKKKQERLERQRKKLVKSQQFDQSDNIEISVWDDYNQRVSIESVLLSNGYKFKYSKGSNDYYLRDGSSSSHSGFVQDNLYINFSDNAGLPSKNDGGAGRKFKAFDLTVFWKYNGDYSEAAKQLINEGYGKFKPINKQPFTGRTVAAKQPKTVSKFEYHKLVNAFIGDVLTGSEFNKKGLYKLLGGTKTGKSNFVATKLKAKKIVIVSQYNTTLQNYEQYGYTKFLSSLEGKIDNKLKKIDYNKRDKITVTFKSLPSFLQDVDVRNFVFVFDEFHGLRDGIFYSIKKDVRFAYDTIKRLSKTNTVILTSANDVDFHDSDIEILKTYRFTKKVERTASIIYNSNISILLETIEKRLSEGKKCLVYTNEKEHQKDGSERKISAAINKNFHDKSVLYFNAETSNGIDLQDLKNDITVCTKSLVAGKDINSQNVACIIYLQGRQLRDFPSSNINQFFGRARDIETASYDLLITSKAENEKYKFYNEKLWFSDRVIIAKAVIKASVNDIAFLHENEKKFVKKDGQKLTIDTLSILQDVSRTGAKYTIKNSNFLTDFLESHSYNVSITHLRDEEKQELSKDLKNALEATKVKNIDKYRLDVKNIVNDDLTALSGESVALKRYEALTVLFRDEGKAKEYINAFDSSAKWRRFINLALTELRLTCKNRNVFDTQYKKDYIRVLRILQDYQTTDTIIQRLSKMKYKENDNRIDRLIKYCQDISNVTDASKRHVIKELEYNFKSSRKLVEIDKKKVKKYSFSVYQLGIKDVELSKTEILYKYIDLQ